jgi:putative ABC transport system permease protein
LRSALVIAEIALALVLLAGAGLLMNSFARMRRVELGYDPRRLMTMTLLLPQQNKYNFAEQVLERVAATPGVESAALMSYSTLGGPNMPFNIESRPLPNGDVTVAYSAVSPAYFRTLGAPLRAGREFNDRDGPESPSVAVINETLARQYFAGENPIGKKLTLSYLNRRLTREIVGVAGDLKQDVLKMVIRQGMTLAVIGVALGLGGAYVLTKYLESWMNLSRMLYGIEPNDPMTYGVMAVLLTVVALIAYYLPARRATKVDPMIALRCE